MEEAALKWPRRTIVGEEEEAREDHTLEMRAKEMRMEADALAAASGENSTAHIKHEDALRKHFQKCV